MVNPTLKDNDPAGATTAWTASTFTGDVGKAVKDPLRTVEVACVEVVDVVPDQLIDVHGVEVVEVIDVEEPEEWL